MRERKKKKKREKKRVSHNDARLLMTDPRNFYEYRSSGRGRFVDVCVWVCGCVREIHVGFVQEREREREREREGERESNRERVGEAAREPSHV